MKVLVVGAGISGCICARRLSDLGHEVTVVEKGRGVGGRMSTRRMNGARIDHGLNFLLYEITVYLDISKNGEMVIPLPNGMIMFLIDRI